MRRATSIPWRRVQRALLCVTAAALAAICASGAAPAAATTGYKPVVGSGSSWSANMLEQWTADVRQFGISVQFASTGSSAGRAEFYNGTTDFGVTEIPYGLTDNGQYDKPPDRGFAYLPIVAGGTSFMYNLKIGGKQVTNLRLSDDVVTKIFTGVITTWDDPAILADNPNLALPAKRIVPVVRSDGSGTTAQFTTWMAKQQPAVWTDFCRAQGIQFSGSCGFTSNFPSVSGFISQSGSLGVSGYVASPSAEGAITYVEYSYALRANFPVVKVENAAGYYVEPTDQAVAVGLLEAKINNDKSNRDTYLTQILDGVYVNPDARAYPLSSYSYMIIPTALEGSFTSTGKGHALADFLYYAVCEGQQSAAALGYSPLPQNLVSAGLEQIRLIPGVVVDNVDVSKCNNPTFSSDGTNTLAATAPAPPACDKTGSFQCGTGTGGAAKVTTPVSRGTGPPEAGAAPAADNGAAAGAAGAGAANPNAGANQANPNGAAAADPAAVADPVTGLLPDGSVDPAAVDGESGTYVDPETGEVLASGTGGTGTTGAAVVAGAPVSAPGGAWTTQTTLMVLAGLCLLAATLGPPLIGRRMAGSAK